MKNIKIRRGKKELEANKQKDPFIKEVIFVKNLLIKKSYNKNPYKKLSRHPIKSESLL